MPRSPRRRIRLASVAARIEPYQREYGWHAYWATEVLAGVQLYMLAPLLTRNKGVWNRSEKTLEVAA